MKKTLLIVNPHAGQMKSKTFLYRIISTLSHYGMLPSVYITKTKGDAKRFASEHCGEYDSVICCGGDGTLNETINGIMISGTNTPLGYIPAGSTNDFASSLGISLSPDVSAKSIALGHINPIDIGRFNSSKYFTYIASFGAFTKASYSTPQNIKNALGHAAYIFEGAKLLQEIKPFKLKYTCDGQTNEGNFMFGAIVNSTSIGGMKLLMGENVKFDDGKFELLLIRFPENIGQTTETLFDFINKNFNTKNIIMQKGTNFTFEFSHPVDFTLDGEYGDSHTVANISVNQKAIKLLSR